MSVNMNVDGVTQPMAGRSLAISDGGAGLPLACGVVGLTDRTFAVKKTKTVAKIVKKTKS